MNKVGQRIKKIRNLLNMSQEELASVAGITKQAISNIENSKSLPSLNMLRQLSVNYNIDLNYVISGIGSYFISQNGDYSKLKETLMKEVESFLDSKGIR